MTAVMPSSSLTLRRWKPYPEYRDSVISWLPRIPKHWTANRLKFITRLAYGESLATENREAGDVPVYGSNGVVGTHSRANTKSATIVVGRKGSFGKVNYLPTPCFAIDTTYYIDATQTKHNLKWLFHLLASLKLDSVSLDTGVPGLSRESTYEYRVPCCSDEEERAIATFLDRETAKIGALIAKREELISLLEEKRAGLISRAVTKGLDPSVPMKESGVEWLGEIPAHWTSRRLRHISDEITVGVVVNPSSYVSDEGVPFLLGGDIREFCINTSNCNRCTQETSSGPLGKSQLNAGDVVVVRVGYPGVAAVVTPDLQGANCASMMLVRKHPRFKSQWLAYAFNSKVGRDQIDIVQYGAAQKQFNISHAVDFSFPFPPLEEQRAIADHLDRARAKIDQIIAKMEAAITCMQEYRTALISAAVTGKIDVRGEAQ